jgi:MarR family transcriptional regulator for hemolysin
MSGSPEETARELLGAVPLVMRTVRAEMRSHRTLDLSVPQFRVLGFVHHYPGTSISVVAEHIGIARPSMSKLIDGLVERKLIVRHSHPDDRRRVTLELNARGVALWQSAYAYTQASLAGRVTVLGGREQATIVRAMHILKRLFNHQPDKGKTIH